jgi:hypothetical protein
LLVWPRRALLELIARWPVHGRTGAKVERQWLQIWLSPRRAGTGSSRSAGVGDQISVGLAGVAAGDITR